MTIKEDLWLELAQQLFEAQQLGLEGECVIALRIECLQ
jgi:hypothetical protein